MKQGITIYLLFHLVTFGLYAQTVINITDIEQANESVFDHVEILCDTSGSYDISQIRSEKHQGNFSPLSLYDKDISKEYTYWLHFFVEGTANNNVPIGLFIPKENHTVEIYSISENVLFTQKTGLYVEGVENSEMIPFSNIIRIEEDGLIEFYLKIRYLYSESPNFQLEFVNLAAENKRNNRQVIFDAILQGMLWLMALYGLFLFFLTRDKLYIFYSLYVIFESLTILGCFGFGYRFLYHLPRSIFVYTDVPNFIAFILYIHFVRHFVNTTKIFPKWDKSLNIIQIILTALIIGIIVAHSTTDATITVFVVQNIIAWILMIFFVAFAIRLIFSKNRLARIIGSGTFLLLIGYGVFSALMILQISYYNDQVFIPAKIGITLELIIFTFGLSYRYYLIEKEKREYQKKLIVQLKENASLKDNVNRELEAKVRERTEEILQQKEEIETQRDEVEAQRDRIVDQKEEIEVQRDQVVSTNKALEKQKRELELALENLKLAQSQLIQSEKMASVGILTAGIAHELNNPINFVSGNVHPLIRDVNDLFSIINKYEEIVTSNKFNGPFGEVEKLKVSLDYSYLIKEIISLLEGIEDGANRSTDIVKGMRSFSRLDEEKPQLYNIHEGIDSALILLQNRIKNRITIRKEYGDLKEIECFPSKLNQVILNILTNSIQAIDDTGEIFIKTVGGGTGAKIFIKDNGKGMTPEVKKHIFDPFYTTKDVGKGTGLGLSISYGIVEQHNGKIDVISETGKGAEFIISLPKTQIQ